MVLRFLENPAAVEIWKCDCRVEIGTKLCGSCRRRYDVSGSTIVEKPPLSQNDDWAHSKYRQLSSSDVVQPSTKCPLMLHSIA